LQAYPEPLRPYVAATIRTLRHARGWSQQELANNVGVEAREISILESGTRDPRLFTLQRLARGLGIELYQLLWQAEALRRWVEREKREELGGD
jgi:transcriptional regulator with XRE-family HTH domain